MKHSLRLVLVAFAMLAAGFPSQAEAATLSLLTGVDAAQTPLGENVADPFWTISVQGGAFVAAEVVNSEVICCGMATVGGQARWISDPSVTDGSSVTGWGIGPTAMARRTFTLSGVDLSTATLFGSWRVADLRQGIYLNGNLIGASTADGGSAWGADQAFNLAAGSGFFVNGLNTLELRGTSINSNWDGFWFDGTVYARDTVPEPATVLLVGGALGAVLVRRRRARG